MQPPPSPQTRPIPAPTFSLIGRQPLRPAALLLAILLAAGSLFLIRYALAHSSNSRLGADGTPSTSGDNSNDQDDKDDPNQIDTIVLGDPSEAPAPARQGNHVSSVHPTLLIILPRSGKDFGMIPNSPAGQLLYAWLAAFNQANAPALAKALPTFPQAAASDAQMSPPSTNRRLQSRLRQRSSTRPPPLPPPRSNPRSPRSPRHPVPAPRLRPRRHRQLQPPRHPPARPAEALNHLPDQDRSHPERSLTPIHTLRSISARQFQKRTRR